MNLLGHGSLLRSMLAGMGSLLFLVACSNNNFRGAAQQGTIDPPPNASENAEQRQPVENGITTAPISSTEVTVPSTLKTKPDSLFASFPSSTIKDASYKFALDLNSVTTSIALVDVNSKKTENFTQNTRSPETNIFKQGNPGLAMTDTFDQTGKKGLVDILVVIDNSVSMKNEQEKLADKMNELLVSIKDANWRISVITTAVAFANKTAAQARTYARNQASEGQEACNTTIINAGDADATAKFTSAVNAGTNGDGNEQGVRQSVVGLRCTEKPWLRAGSSVAVLIVSDEDNCSRDGSNCGNLPWSKENYLTDYIENTMKRTIGKDTGLYGIIAPSKAVCPTAGNAAPQYIRLFNYKSTPGVNYGNICDDSYKTTLNRISDNIALLLTSTFELKNLPDAGSLTLTVQSPAGALSPLDPSSYTLVGKTITFAAGKEPANGSKLIASYRVGAVPMFSSVTLLKDPAPGTITVKVNGAALGAGGFTSNARVISFAQQPPATANIMIDYRLNTALFDRFTLAKLPLNGTLLMKVNNVAVNNFSYDAAKSEVAFTQAPLDGATIQAEYTFREGPKLAYTIPLMQGGSNFKLLDGATPVSFIQQGDLFTIPVAQHQAGKTLTLSYNVADGTARSFDLGHTPLPNTAKFDMLAGNCSLGNGMTIVDQTLIATCAVTVKTEFNLSFKYRGLRKSFELLGIQDPELGTWTIYYEGEATTDYTRTGSTITLNFDPSIDSQVDISYIFPE
jgi:hypothetical protein